ncbi:ribonuclease H [Ligilactobacillus sp. LYQ139]|uniref:ribonuclease H family protein n=1 Tax=Ligilactobacillus sp. LYQ139 TaxID=3378800 RepID=UPI0038532FD3
MTGRSTSHPQHSGYCPKQEMTPNSVTGVVFYSDGGTRNHGNYRGGHVRTTDVAAWAYLVTAPDYQNSASAGEFGSTNNRMELLGMINALEDLKNQGLNRQPVTGVLDSQYVLNGINKHWLQGWQRRGWRTASGTVVANKELWQRIAHLLPAFPKLTLTWTKGHAKNAGNNFVDRLLNKTMDRMQGK